MTERWITQDRFHNAETGAKGNCEQASVASILGLPLEAVPNFIEGENFFASVDAFFLERGFYLMMFHRKMEPDCLYLATGISPRDVMHTVVMRAGKLVHDPHPSRAGILNVHYIRLPIAIDPSKLSFTK